MKRRKQLIIPLNKFNHANTISQVKGNKSLGMLTKNDTLASDVKNKKKPKVIPFDLPILEEEEDENTWHIIPQKKDQLLIGDILLRIKHKGAFSNPWVCRIGFNTAFIFNNQMKYSIKDIDPVSIRKDNKFSPDFSITLSTEPFCMKWNSQTPISKFCNSWNINFESEIKRWTKIHKIIAYHKTTYKGALTPKNAGALHYLHSGVNDYDEVLSQERVFRKQSFRWSKTDWDLKQNWENSDSEDSNLSDSENENEFENDLFKTNIKFDENSKENQIVFGKTKSHTLEGDAHHLDLDEAMMIEDANVDNEDIKQDITQQDQMHMHTVDAAKETPNTFEDQVNTKNNNENGLHEELKEGYDPNKDLFDMVRDQFQRESDSKPKPRNWVFKRKPTILLRSSNSIDKIDSSEPLKNLDLFKRKSSLSTMLENEKLNKFFKEPEDVLPKKI